MNILSILSRLFIITMLATSVYAQQQFTHTVTAQNKGCNAVCSVMDVAELNNNPAAIILITPLDNAGKAHPGCGNLLYGRRHQSGLRSVRAAMSSNIIQYV